MIRDLACQGTVGILNASVKAFGLVLSSTVLAGRQHLACSPPVESWLLDFSQAAPNTIFDHPWCLLELVVTHQDMGLKAESFLVVSLTLPSTTGIA